MTAYFQWGSLIIVYNVCKKLGDTVWFCSRMIVNCIFTESYSNIQCMYMNTHTHTFTHTHTHTPSHTHTYTHTPTHTHTLINILYVTKRATFNEAIPIRQFPFRVDSYLVLVFFATC